MRSRYPKGSLVLPFGLLIGLAALGATGCSDATSAVQQDVAQLRRDLNALTLSVHRGRGDTETVAGQLDRRTREQSAEQGRQLTALSARVDTLAAELGRVAARLDQISQRVETLSREVTSRPGAPRTSISRSREPLRATLLGRPHRRAGVPGRLSGLQQGQLPACHRGVP